MKVKIVGIENVTYTIDGNTITGQKIYYQYAKDGVTGFVNGSLFKRDGCFNVGDIIEIKWSSKYKKYYTL